jgi:hypothetical protein
MKMMYNSITIDDYTFADNGMNDLWAVKLKSKYVGVVYHYGKVKAKIDEVVDNGDGLASLSFQYEILEYGDYTEEELLTDDFRNYIGDVLSHIIQDAFENDKYRIGEDDDTDNNIEKSSNQ